MAKHGPTPEVTIERADPGSPAAIVILRAYLLEVVGRYHGRAPSGAEIARAEREETNDDLRPPHGVLFLAQVEQDVLGCGGLRWVSDQIAELTRVYVAPSARGRGVGSSLLTALERCAQARGARQVRLDTRADLTEALALYDRFGYRAVAPWGEHGHSDRWLAKPIPAAGPTAD